MAMKFRAHETFFIRKGWLSKGMKYIQNRPDVFVSKKENPMDVLGIGSNMVKSLRYWLQTVGLTTEPHTGRRIQNFTELGHIIYNHDRYIEELGTLFLLQYKLASNKDDATAIFRYIIFLNMLSPIYIYVYFFIIWEKALRLIKKLHSFLITQQLLVLFLLLLVFA